jgi:hypothetical protein
MKINHEAVPACNFCQYYSGSGHLPCAVHPYLQVDCPDFQQKEAVDVEVVNVNGWYQVRHHAVIARGSSRRVLPDALLAALEEEDQ